MSEKISRRSAIKALGVAGVALAAVPYLAKASALEQTSGLKESSPAPSAGQHSANSSNEPLVLFVKGDKILGYRGLNEMPVQDALLAGMLNAKFNGATS
jgi:hypothetical protein